MFASLYNTQYVGKDQKYFLTFIQISMKENSYKLVSASAYLFNYAL